MNSEALFRHVLQPYSVIKFHSFFIPFPRLSHRQWRLTRKPLSVSELVEWPVSASKTARSVLRNGPFQKPERAVLHYRMAHAVIQKGLLCMVFCKGKRNRWQSAAYNKAAESHAHCIAFRRIYVRYARCRPRLPRAFRLNPFSFYLFNRQVTPSLVSLTSKPAAASSSRMRSLVVQSLAALALARRSSTMSTTLP